MTKPLLTVLAGTDALTELRDGGLDPARVRTLIGASGGPKWLALHGIDRVLFPWLLSNVKTPLHTLASSIGSWRFACLGARDPVDALDRFADAYVEQRYSKSPTRADVSAQADRILSVLLGPEGAAPQTSNPLIRMHIVTARFRHIGAREDQAQLLAFGLAALSNAIDRRALSLWMERVVFDVGGDPGPFTTWRDLPTRHASLNEHNLRDVLMASGAIPGVMEGVVNPAGAPAGTYRDGGVTDYHFGHEIDLDDGITLYPHFYTELTPGWFDKSLSWRKTRGLRRVVLIAPSAEYVASLPYGRIPDRVDFAKLTDTERMRAWRTTLEHGKRLGDALGELLSGTALKHVVQPLP